MTDDLDSPLWPPMTREAARACILLLTAFSMGSPATAQSYYQTPPIEVYAQRPQPYYAPPPFVAIGNVIGGVVSIPFQLLGGLGGTLFGVPQYQAGIIPDGMGGAVPARNSRIMPDGSLQPYDPGVDGLPNGVPSGPYPSLAPMPEPPPQQPQWSEPEQRPAYDPPQPVYHAPRRPRPPQSDRTTRGCYGPTGAFVGANNPEC